MVVPIKCTCPITGQFTSQQFLISLNVIRNSCLCRIATWERPATLEAETPACRVSAAGCQSLGEGGFPSGTFGDISYEIHRGYLSPGDAELFATDGLHEMRNQQGDDLSWGKLGEIWNQCRYKSADESLDFLFDEVQFFQPTGGGTMTSQRLS
jgi:hypothetical protein